MDLSVIQYPKLDEIKSALFIQPHPDDNEIGAGGTMAKLVKAGIPVYGLTVTEGRGGSNIYPPEKLAEIRKIEASNAMDILGVINLGCLGYHDNNPIIHEKLVKEIVKIIRQIKPEAIFTVDAHLENEMHPVHLQVGKAVEEAFLRSGQAYYPFDEHCCHEDAFSPKIIGFYFTSKDNTIVDITDVYSLKKEAIMAHKSQIDETTMALYEELFQAISADQKGRIVERLKLLKTIHTHCFALPDFLKQQLK